MSSVSISENFQSISLAGPKKNDRFIDFLKGVSIFMVILTHSLPQRILAGTYAVFGIDPAVPLFILIQAWHINNSFVNKGRRIGYFYSGAVLLKIFRRIVAPFCLILGIQISIFYFWGELDWREVVRQGGIGPGSYYIYIYLEIAFLAPLVYYWMRCWPDWKKVIVFVVISELLEIFCSFVSMPEPLYRLLFFRYFFLLYLGFRMNLKDFRLDTLKVCLSVVSIVFIIADACLTINLEPFIFQTAWKGFHWLAYFYTAYVVLYVLKFFYRKFSGKIQDFFCFMGVYSYEIFLLQMAVFSFDIYALTGIPFNYFTFLLFFPLKIILSIGPVFLLKKEVMCLIQPGN